MTFEKVPLEFLNAVSDQKHGRKIDLTQVPREIDRKKMEEFLKEIMLLNVIFPNSDSIPGFDHELEPDIDVQSRALASKMKVRIGEVIESDPKLGSIGSTLIKRKDGQITIHDRLNQTLDLAITDFQVLVADCYQSDIDVLGDDTTRDSRVAASRGVAAYFGRMHGFHEPMIKEEVGRTHDGVETMSYDRDYFIPTSQRIEIDEERLDGIVSTFPAPVTAELHCAALYTPIFMTLWGRMAEIYEICEERFDNVLSY